MSTSKEDWWLNELYTLGIHPKKINALNDIQELAKLTDNIKQTFYQDYKTCYSQDNNIEEACKGSFK
jgi:hypothetical protein